MAFCECLVLYLLISSSPRLVSSSRNKLLFLSQLFAFFRNFYQEIFVGRTRETKLGSEHRAGARLRKQEGTKYNFRWFMIYLGKSFSIFCHCFRCDIIIVLKRAKRAEKHKKNCTSFSQRVNRNVRAAEGETKTQKGIAETWSVGGRKQNFLTAQSISHLKCFWFRWFMIASHQKV